MLIQTLQKIQRELGENDAEFSRRLGITQGYWGHIQVGRRLPARKFFECVLREFPDLGEDCVRYLRSEKTLTIARR